MTNIMSERARRLRREKTDAERRMWRALRNLNRQGFHFRQQAPIGPYIADFADHSAKLVIEIDGGQHGEAHREAIDKLRTKWLERQQYRVLRFWNRDVRTNIDGVMQGVLVELGVVPPTPNPSPQGGGEKERRS